MKFAIIQPLKVNFHVVKIADFPLVILEVLFVEHYLL